MPTSRTSAERGQILQGWLQALPHPQLLCWANFGHPHDHLELCFFSAEGLDEASHLGYELNAVATQPGEHFGTLQAEDEPK